MKPDHLKLVKSAVMRPVASKGRKPNAAYRVREHLTEQEMGKLLTALKANRHGQRDWLVGLLIYRHGLRVSEACDLRWDSGRADRLIRVIRVFRGAMEQPIEPLVFWSGGRGGVLYSPGEVIRTGNFAIDAYQRLRVWLKSIFAITQDQKIAMSLIRVVVVIGAAFMVWSPNVAAQESLAVGACMADVQVSHQPTVCERSNWRGASRSLP